MGSQIEQIGVDIEEVGTAIRSIRYVTTAALIFLLTLPSRRCNGAMLHYHVEEPARRVMAPAGGSCVGSCIILPRDYDENTIPLH